ncbi:MAG: carboxypeptidase regulatory-like domain-containing protein [Bryobacteraceae bacterium]
MKLVYLVSGLLLLALLAPASDVHGRAIITKRLSKRSLSPIVYNLRGTTTPLAAPDTEPVNEFDRMVVILEAAKNDPAKDARKDSRRLPPIPPVTEKLNQQDARFQPDVIVVPVGSTVEFPNLDPIFHNVFSLSKAQPFDLGYYPEGHSRNVKFNNPGVVQVYCHIHANMYAAIVVTDSPWFQKPAPDGSFSFSNVPPGRYRLIAWHKVAGLHKVDVQVPETGSVDATIRVPVDTER